ncbi:hypothetical protein DY000_02050289 [Brassica cretica]|uniref:HAT C-terminal dimerisation domain-containing protein n=1 Tax=Brassica cretica TaxID=69181 RepID=A0ABQ7ER09_BRACR|nr:hypothetical protein DY000_02050289 [Brassica cretica]
MRKKLKLDEEVVNLPSPAEDKEKESANALAKSKFWRYTKNVKRKLRAFSKVSKGKLTLSYEWIVLGHGWTRDSVKGPVLHEGFVCITAHDWKVRRWFLGFTTNDEEEEEMAVQGFEIDGKVSALLLPNDEASRCWRMCVCWLDGAKCSFPNWNVWLSHLQQAVDMKLEDAFSKDELFEGGYSTSNVYFHLLAELKVILEKELEGADSDYFRCKAKGMLKRFDKYWNQMFLVLASACVLDPRFKLKYVEFYCSKKIENDEGSNAESVLDYLRSLYARYAASDICHKPICPVTAVDSKEEDENDDGEGEDCDEEQEEEDCDEGQEGEEEDYEDEEEEEDYEDEEQEEGEEKYDSDSSEEAEREARKNREKTPDACKDFAFFQEFLKFEGSSPREFGESELDAYLKEPVMEWNKDFKALEWWREDGGHKYPILSRVARDILSIPISRVTSYDAYVTGKREPPAFVVSLEAKVANAMMCSKKWLRL